MKGVIYFVFMMLGVFMIRVPREDWKPNNWTPSAKPQAPITTHDVEVSAAVRTPQFYLLWIILCVNVTAGIGIIEQASPMIQDLFQERDCTLKIALSFSRALTTRAPSTLRTIAKTIYG